jgi:outer membrane protein assembly factor BamE (lipoprotein component of BamABCDE complex)
MRHLLQTILVAVIALSATGCMSAAQHRAAVQDDSAQRLTVGTVQREIRVGMPAAEVARVLGAPNIVTTEEGRREVWIYDKIASDSIYSTTQGGFLTLILGGPYVGGTAGARSTSQRTLTVIVRFDEAQRVRDFSYHASSF